MPADCGDAASFRRQLPIYFGVPIPIETTLIAGKYLHLLCCTVLYNAIIIQICDKTVSWLIVACFSCILNNIMLIVSIAA